MSTPSGLMIIDKPSGMTSMDVVAVVRRRAGGLRTGHAGTLDPLATGVLVLALGRATKSIEQLMATDKAYLTEIALDAVTETDDAEAAPTAVPVSTPPDLALIEKTLDRFRGTFEQRPPAYSAVKVGGRRAYKLARRGERPEIPPRPVTVHSIEIVSYRWPRLELAIRCGKGMYVRSLARDLGEALATGGYCLSIRRTAVGPFTIDEAVALDAVPDPLPAQALLPLDVGLARVEAADAVTPPPS